MEQEGETVTWKKFYVHLVGKTNNAHQEAVKKFKSIDQKETKSLAESDYILVFCPIVSRVGTDIGEALESAPGGKPIILVVMHHTFDPDRVIAESRRLVKNQNVKLTVDCLIYQGELLKCHRNDTAWSEVQNIFEKSPRKKSSSKTSQRNDQPASDMRQEVANAENTNQQSTETDKTNEPMEQSPSESSEQVRRGEVQGVDSTWKKFYVHLVGKTNNAHQEAVKKFKSIDQKETKSLAESDYILVFCPIVSRVGTDIGEALESAPGGKPIILVVMHHTFDPDRVIAESRRLVKNQNVKLTVDCLIYEGELLKCDRNDTAWSEVQKIFEKSPRKKSSSKTSQRNDQPASDMKQEVANADNTNQQSTETDKTNEPMEQSPSESSEQVRREVQGVDSTWKKFYVHLVGKTNNAHREAVKKFKSIDQKETKSLAESDYILVFCPIVSRVGTDIGEALESAPGGKPIILVVMHHTFNPDHVIAESRRLVKNQNVKLTVDCLINQGELLKCHRNDTAWSEVQKIFEKSPRKKSSSKVGCCGHSRKRTSPSQ